jgi:hypothetical protein
MTTKEIQENLVQRLKSWQKIEDASVASASEIVKKSSNPLIWVVMEIIKLDSQLHRRVQEFIVDMHEKQAVSLTPEEMGDVWESIERHVEIEKKMVGHVDEMLESLRGRKMLVAEYLLNYLRQDEKKHDHLLSALEKIKKGMYPYA